MLYTVSTVKDTMANVSRFVEGNLRAGVDLLFVFSEDATADVANYLSNHDHVVHLPSTPSGGHWSGNRPSGLYIRQNANANLIRTLLAPFPWATWLFHIDGDEILDIDRDELESIPENVHAVRLAPLEAVATVEGGWDDYFKYPLTEPELALLYTLGAITSASLNALYNGHTRGKVGIRPSLDYFIGIHYAKVGEQQLHYYESDHLRMLHYDSPDCSEFVRKWMAKVGSSATKQRKGRQIIRDAVVTLSQLTHLPQERRQQLLEELYARHVADDAELLFELGFLTRPNEKFHQYTPRRHSKEQRRAIHGLLSQLTDEDPQVYRPVNGLEVQRDVLERALGRAGSPLRDFRISVAAPSEH